MSFRIRRLWGPSSRTRLHSSSGTSGSGSRAHRRTAGGTNLGIDAHMTDSHCNQEMMYNSATDSTRAVDNILSGLDTVEDKLDTLSAQIQSLAETTTNTQNNTSILSTLAPYVDPIVRFALGQNRGHCECDGTNCAFLEGNQRMVQERDKFASRVQALQNDLIVKDKELLEKQREIRRHLEQINKLRGIVLDKAGDQKVSDGEIIQAFLRVRRMIQALAKSPALRVDQIPVLEPDARPHVKTFYGDGKWESWKHKDRELHLRRELFRVLHHLILGMDCFGIEGCQAPTFEKLEAIASGLSYLETLAKQQNVSTSVLVNWRLATLDCVEALDVQEHRSEYVADELFGFLAPVLHRQGHPQSEQVLRAQALELCKDALRLVIMMRKSREEYRCEAFSDVGRLPMVSYESWCEPQAVDGGMNSETGDNVAYVLFGALSKHPAYRGESERVLVKAEVVMEKKSL